MPRFGNNHSKTGSRQNAPAKNGNHGETVQQIACFLPGMSPSDAAKLRRAIQRCRPLLIKDLDAFDIVDCMSSMCPSAAALRTETVRESMLGLAANREEQTAALLDRLDSVCSERISAAVDSSSTSGTTLIAFVTALRRNYRHDYAVLNETFRQLADEDSDNVEVDSDEDVHDDDGLDEQVVVQGVEGRAEVRRRRERVAVAGDAVRKILRRANHNGQNRRGRQGLDSCCVGSSAEMLDDVAGDAARSTTYYSSLPANVTRTGNGNGNDYVDCYIVASRGRLQRRREPWIRHASEAAYYDRPTGDDGHNGDGQPDVPSEDMTYMAVLKKDLLFRRFNVSEICGSVRRPTVPATGAVGHESFVYVVDEESQYSPVADSEHRLCDESAATIEPNLRTVGVSSVEPIGPTSPVRTTSAAVKSSPTPPPLPPKPLNLPSRSGTLQRVAAAPSSTSGGADAVNASTSSPPLPVRQTRNATPADCCNGSPANIHSRLPPAPPPPGEETRVEPIMFDNKMTTAAEEKTDGIDENYEPIEGSDAGKETFSSSLKDKVRTSNQQFSTSTTDEDDKSSSSSDGWSNEVNHKVNSALTRRKSDTDNEGENDRDVNTVDEDQQQKRLPATRDSGIESTGGGFNESPLNDRAGLRQTTSAVAADFTRNDDRDENLTGQPDTADLPTIGPAPSLSDILVGFDDGAEEFARRRTDDDDSGFPLPSRPRSSFFEDDFSYYEDIELLDDAASRNTATYLDPRMTSFTSADGVIASLRRRLAGGGPSFRSGRGSTAIRRHPSSSMQPPPPPPISSFGLFKQSAADRKVLSAGTLLIAQTVLAVDDKEPSAAFAFDETVTCDRYKISDASANTIVPNSLDLFRETVMCHDREGVVYYIPSGSLSRHGDPSDEPWFFPVPLSARDATLFLRREDQCGCFLVYRPVPDDDVGRRCRSSKSGGDIVYNLSVGLGSGGDVVHYQIVRNRHGDFSVSGHDHSFLTVGELVTYFRRNQSRLAVRLGRSLREARLPIAPGCQYPARFELQRSDIGLHRAGRGGSGGDISRGRFGPVFVGRYCGERTEDGGRQPRQRRTAAETVLIKALQLRQSRPEDDDDFLEEALILMGLQHENIARLVGVSCSARPFYVVAEWSDRGSLADCLQSDFLRNDVAAAAVPVGDDRSLPGGGCRRSGGDGVDARYDVCVQIASALLYLESQRYVLHRAVCARNVIVCSDDLLVKLANFDRARLVSDDDYLADPSEHIYVRWAAPEVLNESRYSTKSDVWALGVLFWETFSPPGAVPYATMDAERTAVYVVEGGRLERPAGCPSEIYAMMRTLWRSDPDDRPSFAALHDKIRGETSVYYTCTVTAMADQHRSAQPPSLPAQSFSPTSAAMRSVSDDDRPPMPSSADRCAALLPLPTKASPAAKSGKSGTSGSRRPHLIDVITGNHDKAPRTPSTTRSAAASGGTTAANASNSTSNSDSSSIVSASTTTITGNFGDDASLSAVGGDSVDDLSRSDKIRKSLRKLLPNKKVSK